MPTAAPTDRPLVIGHRGASAHASDNSLVAIDLARRAGADGVEIDVRLTADGIPVLSHDDRIAGGGAIARMSHAELRVGAPATATLDEVPGVLGEMILDLEIKNYPGDVDFDPRHGQAVVVVEWLTRRDMVEQALVSSFNPGTIALVRALLPDVRTGLLLEHGLGFGDHVALAAEQGHQWLLPRRAALRGRGRRRIDLAHRSGLSVGTWTVDDASSLLRLRDHGIDAVITNDPAAALSVYGRGSPR